jgi:CubicO group peptidase (beta-lactamase class C family)
MSSSINFSQRLIAAILLAMSTISVQAQTDASFPKLDSAVQSKMSQFNIPGVSIAIVKNEKLVYVQSYGYADREKGEKATHDNLYRLASISKSITHLAIFMLMQDGKLRADQKIFGPGSILGNDYGPIPAGSSKELITVQHLLDHKSGWSNNPTDPMFTNGSLSQRELIVDLLANWPLSSKPGMTYSYSNFGFMLLGRVIEKVSGMRYEAYVKKEILKPCGITDMAIGGNTLADRLPKEVKYYQMEYNPYGMNITRMDANGGWVATATDLARLIVRVDGMTRVSDLIRPELLRTAYFGYQNWIFNGSLPGTSTTLSRLDDEYCLVMLANTRTEQNVQLILNSMYTAMKQQIMIREIWPGKDLFKR